MKRVITYGTYDLLHYGHIALLRRAKALGDYLIVGVTADGFDKERGKLNVQQSLVERIEAVRKTGIADQIIVEEYEGQKISDIQKYNVDIFTVGSDWVGKFDYLSNYCQVVYLPRTQGVSSTELRTHAAPLLHVGILGVNHIAQRFADEGKVVNGIQVDAVYDIDPVKAQQFAEKNDLRLCENMQQIYESCDAVFLNTTVDQHYHQISEAIAHKCHVITNPPIFLSVSQAKELYDKADEAGVVLFEGNKTQYFPAFEHMLLLVKSGLIGDVRDVDVCCSQIPADMEQIVKDKYQGSLYDWCSEALLPIVQLCEADCQDCQIISFEKDGFSYFAKGLLQYKNATASFRVGRGLKVEGELVITGTKGYIYVPAPWWRTEYFEFRTEDLRNVRKYFYNYEGEGLRYMLYSFLNTIMNPNRNNCQRTRANVLRSTAILEKFDSGDYKRIPY